MEIAAAAEKKQSRGAVVLCGGRGSVEKGQREGNEWGLCYGYKLET